MKWYKYFMTNVLFRLHQLPTILVPRLRRSLHFVETQPSTSKSNASYCVMMTSSCCVTCTGQASAGDRHDFLSGRPWADQTVDAVQETVSRLNTHRCQPSARSGQEDRTLQRWRAAAIRATHSRQNVSICLINLYNVTSFSPRFLKGIFVHFRCWLGIQKLIDLCFTARRMKDGQRVEKLLLDLEEEGRLQWKLKTEQDFLLKNSVASLKEFHWLVSAPCPLFFRTMMYFARNIHVLAVFQ